MILADGGPFGVARRKAPPCGPGATGEDVASTQRKAWLLRVELFLRRDLFGCSRSCLTSFLLPVFIGAPFTATGERLRLGSQQMLHNLCDSGWLRLNSTSLLVAVLSELIR
jgi:hypothetical protein